MELLKKMLKQFGIEEGRFRMDYASASEGDRFAKIVDEMADGIKKLGPYVKYEGEIS
jgi:F420-non-reducing hydrogenase iron-sulfur subunit